MNHIPLRIRLECVISYMFYLQIHFFFKYTYRDVGAWEKGYILNPHPQNLSSLCTENDVEIPLLYSSI